MLSIFERDWKMRLFIVFFQLCWDLGQFLVCWVSIVVKSRGWVHDENVAECCFTQ